MKITIIIPSCSSSRIPLLIKTVESIQAGSYKDVYPVIVADGNPQIHKEANKQLHHVSVIMNKERIGWVASINRVLKEFTSPYYVYAADDLVFPPDCLECAMVRMQECFPDGKGVITLGRKTKAIFGLIGNKWVEHFPDRQVFCPFYKHYGADSEHSHYARATKKFAYSPKRDSQVLHHRLKDETCIRARKWRFNDLHLHESRRKRGILWGASFER